MATRKGPGKGPGGRRNTSQAVKGGSSNIAAGGQSRPRGDDPRKAPDGSPRVRGVRDHAHPPGRSEVIAPGPPRPLTADELAREMARAMTERATKRVIPDPPPRPVEAIILHDPQTVMTLIQRIWHNYWPPPPGVPREDPGLPIIITPKR